MTKTVQVKICGVRDAANIEDIAALTPDYLGFIFYPGSPRYVGSVLRAAQLRNLVPGVKKVGVFVNQSAEEIAARRSEFLLDVLQLHGAETPEFCASLAEKTGATPVIKAFGVDETFDFDLTKAYEAHCRLFLFDTKSKDHGGTGASFDWSVLNNYQGKIPYLLSGGIGMHNLPAALAHVRETPKAIGLDLNSKIERSVGVKAVQLVYQVLHEARK